MAHEYAKPLPSPSPVSQPFWDGLGRGELRVQRCDSCAEYVFCPRPYCPACLSERLTWVAPAGTGRVYSYPVVRRAMNPAFTEDVPYTYAIVELDEGPRVMTNMVGCPPEAVRVDMPVKAVYDRVTPEHTLLRFQPA